ncbi:MAG: hypothetical protein K1X74_08495 [Pirellulales bacterium]|nr:hypothetical protein [Pirellulales bacterium]
MNKAALVRCPGCDLVIRVTSAICPNCMRCLGCGARRNRADPPCRCGHPDDPEALAKFVHKFGLANEGLLRDHEHNLDPHVDPARIGAASVKEMPDSAELEAAWAEWSQYLQNVDDRGMLLIRAAFEAGWEAVRSS